VRTGFKDERVVILEGVGPFGDLLAGVLVFGSDWARFGRNDHPSVTNNRGRPGKKNMGNIHSVSGAVGAQHRHLHIASIMLNRSSLSTYLKISSTF
jgi:hypothetical protein